MVAQIVNLPEGMHSSELPLEFYFCDFLFWTRILKTKSNVQMKNLEQDNSKVPSKSNMP